MDLLPGQSGWRYWCAWGAVRGLCGGAACTWVGRGLGGWCHLASPSTTGLALEPRTGSTWGGAGMGSATRPPLPGSPGGCTADRPAACSSCSLKREIKWVKSVKNKMELP